MQKNTFKLEINIEIDINLGPKSEEGPMYRVSEQGHGLRRG